MEFLPSAECNRVLEFDVFQGTRGYGQFHFGVLVNAYGVEIPYKKFKDLANEKVFVSLFLREACATYARCVSGDREAKAYLPRFDAELIVRRSLDQSLPVLFDISNKGFINPPDFIISIQSVVDRALAWRQ